MAEIARTLGHSPETIPSTVDEKAASTVLGVKPSTLANWRTTGRYALPFLKVGRLVRYRTSDLAAWIARRRVGAEG
nr:helix-turn-helix domain-containing protein [Acidithiobacillus caldus]